MAQVDDVFQLRTKQVLYAAVLRFRARLNLSPKIKSQDFSAPHAKTLQSLNTKINLNRMQNATIFTF
jgi:hypothetical protein